MSMELKQKGIKDFAITSDFSGTLLHQDMQA